ncbi:MAG: NAD-dependent epimerase/dehydratase family protein [Gemmatimonadaceae bacterium]
MRVLVIGGTGFIGRFVVPQLVDGGHDVAVFQRPDSAKPVPAGVHSIRGDRHDLSASAAELRAFAPDVVVDLILSSGRQAAVLMELFRGHAGRVVAASSIDVYRAMSVVHRQEEGPLEPLPLREDSALRTKLHPYPAAQIRAMQQVFAWLDEEYDKIPVEREVLGHSELPGTALRLPMIYGPGDPRHRFFPMLKRMDDGRPVIVLSRSVAGWRSPRGYVENVAGALALAATSDVASGRIYNVAEAESFSELEWARMLADATGWSGEFVVVEDDEAPASVRMAENLAQHLVADTTRIRSELGYRESIARGSDQADNRVAARAPAGDRSGAVRLRGRG